EEELKQYAKSTPEELYAALGVRGNRIPSLAEVYDQDGEHTSWDSDWAEWLKTDPDTCPVSLFWHQLVGVVKMSTHIVEQKPVANLDEVGLGKTLQAIATIMVRIYLKEHFAQFQRYPEGSIGESFAQSLTYSPRAREQLDE
ncbi:hypothetical protein BDW22DRAFT_1339873, partial [Trametopsis cervina]